MAAQCAAVVAGMSADSIIKTPMPHCQKGPLGCSADSCKDVSAIVCGNDGTGCGQQKQTAAVVCNCILVVCSVPLLLPLLAAAAAALLCQI